jgi:hypothetical protein
MEVAFQAAKASLASAATLAHPSPSAGGLLDRSTARYFYKRLKPSLHKPTDNLLENLFCRKCAFKNNSQLLEKKVSVSNKHNT